MNLTALSAAVYERTGLATADPSMPSATVTNLVNFGMHQFELANPRGWDWLRYDGSFSTVAGTDSYSFATIDATKTIMKLIEVRIQVGAGTFRDSIRFVSKAELMDDYRDQTQSTPTECAVDGQALWLRPVPDGVYTVRFTAVRAEPDLATGNDTPITPAIYHQAIVEKAAELAFRRVQNRLGAQIAQAAYNELVSRARAYGNPRGGPGHVRDTTFVT